MRTIQYGIDPQTYQVWSRVGSEVAVPVLDFESGTFVNNFTMDTRIEKFSVFAVASDWNYLKHTRKIPIEIKNIHRKFWGFKELKFSS